MLSNNLKALWDYQAAENALESYERTLMNTETRKKLVHQQQVYKNNQQKLKQLEQESVLLQNKMGEITSQIEILQKQMNEKKEEISEVAGYDLEDMFLDDVREMIKECESIKASVEMNKRKIVDIMHRLEKSEAEKMCIRDSCMVDVAKFFLDFTVDESCGKCPPCRIGTKRMLEILQRITDGKGKPGDIEKLIELGESIKAGALCGLGKTAPNPVLSTIKYFRDEYEAHIYDKRCPAGHCQQLLVYEIIPSKCIGCGMCARVCPADAITGEKKQPHHIDPDKCIKCGACIEKCKFDAIKR